MPRPPRHTSPAAPGRRQHRVSSATPQTARGCEKPRDSIKTRAGRGVQGPATNYRLCVWALPAHRVREATCGVKECPVTRWAPRVPLTKSEAEGQKSPLVYLQEELSLGPPSASAGAAPSESFFFLFPALNGP